VLKLKKEINKNQEMKLEYLCRHLRDGRTVIPKICIHRYECWKCSFDQWLGVMEKEIIIPANAV